MAKPLGEMGVFGATLKGYGCAGLDNVAYGLIMQELERGDSGLRSFASVQSGARDVPDLRLRLRRAEGAAGCRASRRGEALGCFGLTEPDHGSDPGGMKTRAVRKGDEYVLNGTKIWITNGSVADVAVVWAKGDDGEIRGFLVEKGTPGFSTLDIHGKFSHARVDHLASCRFQDCRIPLDAKLPGVEGAARAALVPLPGALRHRVGRHRRGHGAATTGRSSYAQKRIQFGKPIGVVPARPAEARLDDHRDHQGPAPVPAARPAQGRGQGAARSRSRMAKRNNVQMALDGARMARDILGANGIVDEYPIMRHMMNLETVNTYEGTHDIHTLIVGRDITGLDAFGI